MKLLILTVLSLVILVEARPDLCKDPNAEYTDCGSACPQSCENKESGPCADVCVEGCFCKEGFILDKAKNGKCVLYKECPDTVSSCEDPNSEFKECGTACPLTCENKDNPPQFCTLNCVVGCFCKKGYVKDTESGLCVRPKDCPSCGKNEEWSECGANGCQNTCENPTLGQVCKAMCMPGCVCKEGYLRDDKGNCVKPEKCPNQKCPAGEEWSDCGAYCQRTCGPPTPCAAPPQDCNPGCVCPQGYVRETHGGRCIRQDKCPPDQGVCGVNEEWSECDAHGCQNTCSEPNRITYCTYVAGCYPGCICSEGFLRDDSGNCVPQDQCPPSRPDICSLPLETGPCRALFKKWGYDASIGACREFVYGGCGGNENRFDTEEECLAKCPAKVCRDTEVWSDSEANSCQMFCEWYYNPESFACRPSESAGCICQEGLIRDSEGNCIPPDQCPEAPKPVCGENEEFNECGTACPKTCEDKGNFVPKPCTANCVVGCFCLEGYLRDTKSGLCVLPDQCPPLEPLICGANETYVECSHRCVEGTCESKENRYCGLRCEQKCECNPGYVRDSNKNCIREADCPGEGQPCKEKECKSWCVGCVVG